MLGTPGGRHPSFPSTEYESVSVNQAAVCVSFWCSYIVKTCIKHKPLCVLQLFPTQSVKPTKASALTAVAMATTSPKMSRRIFGAFWDEIIGNCAEELVERMLKQRSWAGKRRWDEEKPERRDARRGPQGNTYSSQ